MLEQYDDVLKTDEACEALRIGYNALYELLNSGALKDYRNGRTWRIPKRLLRISSSITRILTTRQAVYARFFHLILKNAFTDHKMRTVC